jgi:hypothetical protein
VAKRAHRIDRPHPRSVRRNQDPSGIGIGIGIAESPIGPTIVVLAGQLGHAPNPITALQLTFELISRSVGQAAMSRLPRFAGCPTSSARYRHAHRRRPATRHIQNTGWTPDGRSYFGNGWAIGRGAMPDGLALQTHVVAENDRGASMSVWDATITARAKTSTSPRPTSWASRKASPPNIGTPSTTFGCTRRSACSHSPCDPRGLMTRVNRWRIDHD